MSGGFMPLRKAAEHVHVDANELRHVAQRGEIEASERSGEWYFEHSALDEWAQRNILSAGRRAAAESHRSMMDRRRRESRGAFSVSSLLRECAVDVAMAAKAKAGMIRDMTDLAESTGLVYDAEALFRGIVEREDAASTAIGEGVAFLHPKRHDPYLFEESFLAYGRSERPIFFGAPDGAGTRHFFLVCSVDHEEHLQILARLAVLAHGTDLVGRLDGAASAEDAISAVREAEKAFAE